MLAAPTPGGDVPNIVPRHPPRGGACSLIRFDRVGFQRFTACLRTNLPCFSISSCRLSRHGSWGLGSGGRTWPPDDPLLGECVSSGRERFWSFDVVRQGRRRKDPSPSGRGQGEGSDV